MRRLRMVVLCCAALICGLAAGEPAWACPMCKVANESEGDARPRAYMYSILFMLSVPAMLTAGFGIGFYRLSKRRQGTDGWLDPTRPDAHAQPFIR